MATDPITERAHALLTAARVLLDQPEAWNQGDYTNVGWGACPCDPRATSWCALGAIYRAAGSCLAEPDAARDLAICRLAKAADVAAEADVIEWNDNGNRTHPEVLAVFERAISLAKEAA